MRGSNCQLAGLEEENLNRRKSDRFRTFKKGMVYLPDDAGKFFCSIRDFSSTGARLKFDVSCTIPDTFTLSIEENRVSVDCRVVWRSENELGVEFPLMANAKS